MRPWVLSLLLAAIVLSLYSASLGHAFLFDEENIILKNPYIKDPSLWPELFKRGFFYMQDRAKPLWTQYYRPLTALTFAFDFFFWKSNPIGYNLTSLLLHALVCVLLFVLLRKMFADAWAAFLACLLFAVHPVHTEAVTYTASRSDPLSGVFLLSILLLYWSKRRGLALFIYALSLFVKESLILTPLYLFFFEVSFIRGDKKANYLRMIPFALTGAVFYLLRKTFGPVPLGPDSIDLYAALLRLFSMGRAWLDYLLALVLPPPFKFGGEIFFAKQFFDLRVLETLIMAGALGIAWCALYRKKGEYFFAFNFILIAFIPSLQIVPYIPQWADHYLYLPFMGITVFIAGSIKKIISQRSKKIALIFFTAYFLFLGFLCYRTLQRNKVYSDAEQFYTTLAASDSPFAFYGHQNLGRLLLESEHWHDALGPLQRAVDRAPYSDTGHALLGRYYTKKQDHEKAYENFKIASDLDPQNNEFLMNESNSLVALKRYKEALAILQIVMERNPQYTAVYLNGIAIHDLDGNAKEAERWGQVGIGHLEGQPLECATILAALGRMAYRQGHDEESRKYFQEILHRYQDVSWYPDVAKLLLGEISEEEFQALVASKYIGFEYASRNFLLLSYVWNKKPDHIEKFLSDHAVEIQKAALIKPLFIKEVERAKNYLESERS